MKLMHPVLCAEHESQKVEGHPVYTYFKIKLTRRSGCDYIVYNIILL